ncbi:hypothetical protein [Microbacterium sp. 13-71-7]|uniref:hypothetical protein n=1 Tax=Microbacterium sp. 13-71-7 TaxID=1970399 RepID=UPI0025CC9668|nr:hypothetical protein [Microbacterium sp. 13-71-7]
MPADQQGLATGLVTMSQQVGITLGTPVMSAIATGVAASTLLPGLHLAELSVDSLAEFDQLLGRIRGIAGIVNSETSLLLSSVLR